jgi:hypothetical protein
MHPADPQPRGPSGAHAQRFGSEAHLPMNSGTAVYCSRNAVSTGLPAGALEQAIRRRWTRAVASWVLLLTWQSALLPSAVTETVSGPTCSCWLASRTS